MDLAPSKDQQLNFHEKIFSPGFVRAWASRFRAPEIEG
jgi:hypothetical protein